jgi:hypothetical protein
MLEHTVSDTRSVISFEAAAKRERDSIPFFESFKFLNSDSSIKRILILAAQFRHTT